MLDRLPDSQPEFKTPDYSRKPLCECGEGFLSWIESVFPEVREDVTHEVLDEMILTLTKEYTTRLADNQRNGKFVIHRLSHCLPDVHAEVTQALTDKQTEIERTKRLKIAQGKVQDTEEKQSLFIASEKEKEEWES